MPQALSYEYSHAAVDIRLSAGRGSGGHAEDDEFSEVENIVGSAHNDRLEGDDNDNWLTGGAGADTLIGGAGNDAISYAGSDAAVDISLRAGQATGGHAQGDVFATVENIVGSAHNDRLEGDDNDNWLTGGAGADTLIGGPGWDAISYADSDAAVDINLSTGQASGGHAEGDVFATVEQVIGSVHNDRLEGDDNDNWLTGGAGADTLIGGPGWDVISYADSDAAVDINLMTGQASGGHAQGDVFATVEIVIGSAHNDRLEGDDSDNWLIGGAGNDTLTGGPGADTLTGGAGSDAISYADSDEAVTINLSTGQASGGHAEGDEFSGVENIFGSAHNDRLEGDGNDNWLTGGAGDDTLIGGDGLDAISYADSDEAVDINLSAGQASGGHAEGDEFSEVENIVGSAHNDQLEGDNNDNWLTGGAGDDRLYGNGGDDELTGGAGADQLYGGAGNDWLDGGAGNDRLTGGTSLDIFVFAPGDSLGRGDVITDFTVAGTARDVLNLLGFDFDLASNADGSIATTLKELESQGLTISDLMDADGDEEGIDGKDDREITLPGGGKITLLDAVEELTIDNFVFDLS